MQGDDPPEKQCHQQPDQSAAIHYHLNDELNDEGMVIADADIVQVVHAGSLSTLPTRFTYTDGQNDTLTVQ